MRKLKDVVRGGSVADPGCLSDPEFYQSQIPDPKTAVNEKRGNFIVLRTVPFL